MDGCLVLEGPGSPLMSSGLRVERSELGLLSKLDSGGQGDIFLAPEVELGLPGQAVYKEYNVEDLTNLDASLLEKLVSFLESLPFRTAREIVGRAAWPERLVVDDTSRIVGVIMPRVPPEFYINLPVKPGVTERRLAELQFLPNTDAYLAEFSIPITDRLRYELLHHLAESLDLFHRHHIVVGDISHTNVLFSLAPHPRVFFLDCDTMRLGGKSALAQVETAEWDIRSVSSAEPLGTPFTDRYKLGLVALRLFAQDLMTRNPDRLPSRVPVEVRSLIQASLSLRPAERPEPAAWLGPLKTASRMSATTPPTTIPPSHPSSAPQAKRSRLSTSGPTLRPAPQPQRQTQGASRQHQPYQHSPRAPPNRPPNITPRRQLGRTAATILIIAVLAAMGIAGLLEENHNSPPMISPPTTVEPPTGSNRDASRTSSISTTQDSNDTPTNAPTSQPQTSVNSWKLPNWNLGNCPPDNISGFGRLLCPGDKVSSSLQFRVLPGPAHNVEVEIVVPTQFAKVLEPGNVIQLGTVNGQAELAFILAARTDGDPNLLPPECSVFSSDASCTHPHQQGRAHMYGHFPMDFIFRGDNLETYTITEQITVAVSVNRP